MRPLLAAAVLALAAPDAAGALSLTSRDIVPGRAGAAVRVARFDLVGLHWRGSGEVRFRTRTLAGRWSAWHIGAPEDDDLPDRGTEGWSRNGWRIGSPFWTGGADAIQYRTVGQVSRVRAFFVRSSNIGLRGGRRPELASRPEIITRSGWRANEAIVRAPPRYADSVHLAIVHHTAGSNSYTASQSASIVRAIEVYHVQGNGWNDIGYNFLVDRYGQIFEGRGGGMTRAVIGAHAEGFNVGTVGIAVIGDYGSATVTPAARAALVSLLAWRLDLEHVDPLSSVVRISTGNPRYPAGRPVTLQAISGHRDVYPTSCPGTSLYAQLPAIRSAVSQTGLPKLYSPAVTGALGDPIRFTARLSAQTAWAVTVRDASKAVIASGAGSGTSVDWSWDATQAVPGQYSWTMTAPELRPATGTIGAASTPLALTQLRIVPSLVTPNGHGKGDQARISYELSGPALVTATLLDDAGNTVATLFSERRPAGAQSFAWSDVTVPNGRYRLSLVAKDSHGSVRSTVVLVVDRAFGGFTADTPVYSPNGDGRLDTVTFAYTLYAPADAKLEIVRGSTVAATVLADAHNLTGTMTVTWGGRLPDGLYSAVLTVNDSGTMFEQSLPLRVDTTAPVLRLVSLRDLLFRLNEPRRVVIALNGRWRSVMVKRPGLFHVGYRGSVRSLTAYATDAAGNRGAILRVRR